MTSTQDFQGIIIIKEDIEANLIASGNEETKSKKLRNKRIAYGILILILSIGAGVGIYLVIRDRLHVSSSSAQPVSKETDQDQELKDKEQSSNKTISSAFESLQVSQDNINKGNSNIHSNKKKENRRSRSSLLSISSGLQYVPDTFDLRTSTKAVGCNFISVIDEKLCVGGNWSNQIAQTISNTICLQKLLNTETALSAQYILDCSELEDKCDILKSREDFELQLSMVGSIGIPTAKCIPYNGLNYLIKPSSCDATCQDGSKLSLKQYGFVDLWNSDVDNLETVIQNVKSHIYGTNGPALAFLKHTATIARYTGAGPNGIFVNDQSDETNFGYRIYKIVAWNIVKSGDSQKTYWIMANTFSSNWGMSGYLRIAVDDPIIEGYYGYKSI